MKPKVYADRSKRVDIVHRAGDSFNAIIPVVHASSGASFNFTDYTAQLIVSAQIYGIDVLIFEDGSGLVLSDGKITLAKDFDDTELQKMGVGDYIYNLVLTKDGNKTTWLNGKFIVNEKFNSVPLDIDPILVRLEITADETVSDKIAYVDCGTFDASTGLFPTTGGSGSLGAIKRGNTFDVSIGGNVAGQFIPAGSTIRALIDTPGQVLTNWRITF